MNHPKMPITYDEALEILQIAAQDAFHGTPQAIEIVSPFDALGRILATPLNSPATTPAFDSSAMDGYAVSSSFTTSASESAPVVFRVQGTIAAGDATVTLETINDIDGIPLCVEIMTGAQFPVSKTESNDVFDACVPIEHTRLVSGPRKEGRYIEITRPISKQQHRRSAGGDFSLGQRVLESGCVIEAHHVMAMASLGLRKVSVRKRLRVGVWSTGAELLHDEERSTHGKLHDDEYSSHGKLHDANGPYLVAALRTMGVDVTFLGILEDDPHHMEDTIGLSIPQFDVLITSGAVSAGKFDFVYDSVVKLGADIKFHKVSIRPGHPMLFATLPAGETSNDGEEMPAKTSTASTRRTAFFGLPGNPIATAACFRMLVTPYLQQFSGRTPDKALFATVVPRMGPNIDNSCGQEKRIVAARLPAHVDIFRHGLFRIQDAKALIELSDDQGPARVRPFSQANCWVHIPRGHGDVFYNETFACFSLVDGISLL